MYENIGVFKDFKDNSLKTVFEDEKKRIIEMTLLFNKHDKDVVCVPTHNYCNLGCKMCHLTNVKVNKPMIPIMGEDFLTCLIETLTKNENNKLVKRTNKKKLLISFMGVGEPLLNISLIKYVFLHENILKKRLGYEAIGYALATIMPNENLNVLTEVVNKYNIPLKVHFSLHNPIDEKRFQLLPSTNVKVERALELLNNYREIVQSNEKIKKEYVKLHRTSDPTEIHYTLIKDLNDQEEELNILLKYLKIYKIPIKFIKFNPKDKLEISASEAKWINKIKTEIPDLRVKTYAPPGKEIGASCGEFTKHYYHYEIETSKEKQEFEVWKKLHQVEINS